MVQGNLLALTFGHWLIASRTGLVAGTVATLALLLAGHRNRWIVAGLIAGATILADYLSHPSHFGGVVGEAIVTGLAAGALSLVVGWVWKGLRARMPARRPAA